MLQPENQNKKYDFLFADIDSGRIKIPKFQRDFVWSKEQSAKLIDSIIKGFPIGTFIFWKTTDELRHVKNIGNVNLPDPPSGEPISYVLDGQQRITSLYAVRKGVRLTKDGVEINYGDIAINLDLDPDSDEQVVSVDPPAGVHYITVHDLLTSDLKDLIQNHMDYIEKIDIYKKRLTTYDFSTIVINNYPLDIACEVFTRINTGGTELTLFEIMVAKTFDSEQNFDLAERYQWLMDNKNNGKDLEDAGYDTIPASTVLQCVSACLTGQIRRRDILRLNKDQFIQTWPKVTDAIFSAVDFFRSYLRIPVSGLLPYNPLLIPFTYFFYKTNGNPPDHLQEKLLSQLFWWISLGSRYSSGLENKVAQDIDRVNAILRHEQPNYQGEEIRLSMDDLRYRGFSAGDAFCKALLCLYAYQQPCSFSNNSLVKMDNSWLKTSISKNYHHFFPRAYLGRIGIPSWQANSVLNITIVDDFLNKRVIRDKAPSDYMKPFLERNKHLAQTMRSHLIDDLEQFGIWQNDYQTFLNMRGQRVMDELNSRLYPVME